MDDQQHSQPIFLSTPLEQVREGMSVIDADGRPLGTVTRLQLGDPQAVTTAGNEPSTSAEPGVLLAPAAATQGGAGVVGSLWGSDIDGLGDVPDVLRRDLRRAGFIQVDGVGLEGAKRFIPGDRIAEVSDDIVRLHAASTGSVAPAEIPRASTTAADRAPHSDGESRPVERVVVTPVHQDATARQGFAPRVLVSGGATAVLGSAGIAAWVYRRWRREQARPINRLRRATAKLYEPLAVNAPSVSGAVGSVLLLVLFTVARWRRRDTHQAESVESASRSGDAAASAQQLRSRLPGIEDLALWRQQAGSDRSRPGVRLVGGLLALFGFGLLIWRVRRGQEMFDEHQTATVQVSNESVVVEAQPVQRQTADRPMGEGGHETLDVPVQTEQVTIEKLLGSAEAPSSVRRRVQEGHGPGTSPGEQPPPPEPGRDAKKDPSA
jgi:uncharacterized protein (TIGR02271 family)